MAQPAQEGATRSDRSNQVRHREEERRVLLDNSSHPSFESDGQYAVLPGIGVVIEPDNLVRGD